MKHVKGNLLLLLASVIWGSAYVAQKAGIDPLGPFAFNGIRTVLGGLALMVVIALFGRNKNSQGSEAVAGAGSADTQAPSGTEARETAGDRKTLLLGGLFCGLALFVAGNLQQVGIIYASITHTGFITALYVVVVPLLGLLIGKKITPIMWGCVAAATVGLYLLCVPAGGFGSINGGDIIVFFSSIVFAVHILIIDHFSPKVDGVKLSCLQFLVAGVLALIAVPIADPALGYALPTAHAVAVSWQPILYAGLLSCAIGYTLQVVGQKDTDPTIATMILSLEAVFALLCGMIFLKEAMTLREVVGCIVMFAAILVANLPGATAERE